MREVVMLGRRRRERLDDPRLEEIVRQSRDLSNRLEAVADRLEHAVDRLAREINDHDPAGAPRDA